jgi:hypothetical protein
MERTNRKFRDIENNEVFMLCIDKNGGYHLISDGSVKYAAGTSVNGFYISAHHHIILKLNNSNIIRLPRGFFYNMKEDEKITHKKYFGEKRFKKES